MVKDKFSLYVSVTNGWVYCAATWKKSNFNSERNKKGVLPPSTFTKVSDRPRLAIHTQGTLTLKTLTLRDLPPKLGQASPEVAVNSFLVPPDWPVIQLPLKGYGAIRRLYETLFSIFYPSVRLSENLLSTDVLDGGKLELSFYTWISTRMILLTVTGRSSSPRMEPLAGEARAVPTRFYTVPEYHSDRNLV